MTKEQIEREAKYRAARAILLGLFEKNLLTRREFVKADAILREFFSPVWGGLYQKVP
jgi:transcriptional regulator CtsR